MLLSIIGIVVAWLVLGFLINFICYSDTPENKQGNSATAKNLHKVLNIMAVIAIVGVLFS